MPDLTELRDELARVCGWHVPDPADPYWEKDGRVEHHSWHPFPPNDLNALAAVWPEGWKWGRLDDAWWAYDESGWGDRKIEIRDTGDEYADRLRLTLAVLKEKAHA